jgi:uncharacterized membrane protein YraQ (UPF0718 family)
LRAASAIAPVVLPLAGFVVALLLQRHVGPWTVLTPALQTWFALVVGLCAQAAPFLALGVIVSAVLAAFVPADAMRRFLPYRPGNQVLAAGLAGVVLPGCECASVPVACSLIRRGTHPAAALTFLLAAPAINPVVLVATAIAFPGRPMMVIARFVASLSAALVIGWIWVARAKPRWLSLAEVGELDRGPDRRSVFRETAAHDFVHAGGFLVFGAMMAAGVKVLVPSTAVEAVASHGVLAVVAIAVLALIVCVCSEADAFVAASLTAFSPTAQLVFMTVSPMVDAKLMSMQAGFFGGGFVARFAPLTFVVTIAVGSLVGWVML